MESTVYIFAYGSNMCTPRMRLRVPSAMPVAIGYVCQREFVYHKQSDDGSAKANAAFTGRQTDRVWGIIYRMHRADKPILDDHEFLGHGYDQEELDVIIQDGSLRAWVYVARREMIDSSLRPYSWYSDFVIFGARQHRLPDEYINYLQSFECVTDPDYGRHKTNRRLIDA